jgi:hypothetical protein
VNKPVDRKVNNYFGRFLIWPVKIARKILETSAAQADKKLQ